MRLVWLFCALLFASVAHAQTTAVVSPPEKARYFDNNGVICSGCLVFSYAGGTSTPIATYTDSTGGTPNTNPVTLDSTGQANIWFLPTTTYKISLSPAGDLTNSNPFWTVDNVSVASPIPIPIPNSKLANSSITIAGHTVALGGTQALQASDLTNGVLGSGAIVLTANGTFSGEALVWNGSAFVPGSTQLAPNIVTSNYTIQTSDCYKTVQAGTGTTGFFVLTLPSASGFTAGCYVIVKNGDTIASNDGKALNGFPIVLYPLFPTQSLTVQVVNGAWTLITPPGRWLASNPTFYVDANSGSDSQGVADGLGAGARAFKTITHCINVVYGALDVSDNSVPVCAPTCGEIFTESVAIFGQPGLTNVFQINGNGAANCQFTWLPTSLGTTVIQIGDNAEVGISGAIIDCNGGAGGCYPIFTHQLGVIDLNANVTINSRSSTVDMIHCDAQTKININNGLTVYNTNNLRSVFAMNAGCNLFVNGAITTIGTITVTNFLMAEGSGANILFTGNATFSGMSFGATAVPYLIYNNAAVCNLSGASLPGGGVGTAAQGGVINTSNCAI